MVEVPEQGREPGRGSKAFQCSGSMIDVNGVEEGPKVLLDKGPGPALQSLVYARMGVANRGPWQAAKVAVGAPLLGPGSELPYHQSRSGAPMGL